jgi:hypothetical protein
MDGDDYLIVMVYVNQYCLDSQLNLAKLTCLIVGNLDASRLMSY